NSGEEMACAPTKLSATTPRPREIGWYHFWLFTKSRTWASRVSMLAGRVGSKRRRTDERAEDRRQHPPDVLTDVISKDDPRRPFDDDVIVREQEYLLGIVVET